MRKAVHLPGHADVVPNVAGLVDNVSLAQIQAVTAGVWMLVLGAVLLLAGLWRRWGQRRAVRRSHWRGRVWSG